MAVSGCQTMMFIGRKGETQQQKVKILAAATKGRSESKIKQFCNGMLFNRKHGIYFRNNLSQILFYKVKCVCKCLYVIISKLCCFCRNAEYQTWLSVLFSPAVFAQRNPGVPWRWLWGSQWGVGEAASRHRVLSILCHRTSISSVL